MRPVKNENGPPRANRRIGRKLFAVLLVFVVLIGLAYLERAPILSGVARAWIIDEPVSRADAIVIIGGGLQTRTFAAARMYHQGIATNILIARSKLSPTDRIGLTQPERVLAEKVLTEKGVPAERIQTFGEAVTSTKDEAIALREWALAHPEVKTIIVSTELFHTRRVKWIFGKVFKQTSVKVKVTAIEQEEYTSGNWWQHEEGFIAFELEVVKSAFYHLKYRRLQ